MIGSCPVRVPALLGAAALIGRAGLADHRLEPEVNS
jgi:hypothetical protein